MREIEFRGKDIKTKEWHYGSLVSKYDVEACLYCQYHILEKSEYSRSCDWDSALADVYFYEVDEDTLGQFTGLYDKNGTKIFEGDVVNMLNITDYPMQIKWSKKWARFIFYNLVNKTEMNLFTEQCEVIGNIYDNPELVKE